MSIGNPNPVKLFCIKIEFQIKNRIKFLNFLNQAIINILQKRYGDGLVKKVRKLEKCDFKYKRSLHEIIKSVNSQINTKSPVNEGLIIEFYKHFQRTSFRPFRSF